MQGLHSTVRLGTVSLHAALQNLEHDPRVRLVTNLFVQYIQQGVSKSENVLLVRVIVSATSSGYKPTKELRTHFLMRNHTPTLSAIRSRHHQNPCTSKKSRHGRMLIRPILRGARVFRTHHVPKNPYLPLFLHIILGPDYYIPPQRCKTIM